MAPVWAEAPGGWPGVLRGWAGPQTIAELCLLLLAFVLSAVVGAERQRKLKSAGLRTHTLVGLGAAVFTIVSGYGFRAVVGGDVVLDPSRIAAQIVSGIGFLGAGIIFVRKGSSISGLTTAASIWVTAAIGMACGAGLPLVAVAATALQLFAVTWFGRVARWLTRSRDTVDVVLRYRDGRGILRDVLLVAADMGYETSLEHARLVDSPGRKPARVEARLQFRGNARTEELVERLSETKGVSLVHLTESDAAP